MPCFDILGHDSLSPAFLKLGQHQIQTVGFGPTRSENQNPT
jgi:hypothetical protein